MNYRLEFTIPELPKTTNSLNSLHWRAKGSYVKQWHRRVWAAVGGNKPPKPLVKAKLTLLRKSSVEPDYDGLVSSFKAIIDGLIVCGVLENDKFSNIGQSDYRWELCKRKQGAIQVIVEGLGAVSSDV